MQAMSGPSDSVFNQIEKAAVPNRPTMANNARYWGEFLVTPATTAVRPLGC